MPQTPFEAQPDELAGYRMFLRVQRTALLEKIDGLTDEQATSKPTSSDFCMLTLLKHVAFCDRRWMASVAGRDMTGLWPPSDPGEELRIDPGDTVASIRSFYESVVADAENILDGDVDLDTVDEFGLNNRWILLHLVEELARHAGHADIIRESIDRRTGV